MRPKSNQSSGCTHIHQTSRKSLNNHCFCARKLMAAVFWDKKGVLMVEFMQQGTAVTSQVCCETLKNCIGSFRTNGVVRISGFLGFVHRPEF
jgi:hypothetical protein